MIHASIVRGLSVVSRLGVAILLLCSMPRPAAAGQQLCAVGNCCTTCTITDCDTGRHDRHCSRGVKLVSVTRNDFSEYQAICEQKCGVMDYDCIAACSQPAILCQQQCDQIAAAGSLGVCKPYTTTEPEIAGNGIDDNCDGVFPGEDICNGKDDDGDNRPDNTPGSCAERHLFVPYCWNANGLTQAQQQASLQVAVDRWEQYFAAKSGIRDCTDRTPIWYEAASIGYLDTSTWDCANPPDDFIARMLDWVRTHGSYDLLDWDVVAFVTNPASVGGVGGQHQGGGVITLVTGGTTPLVGGEFGWFVHEWGHAIGLSEEYRIVNSPPYNPLDVALGCDPGAAVSLTERTPAFYAALGPCCFVFPPGCNATDPTTTDPPTYCSAVDTAQIGYRCLGNEALALDFWHEGDPDPGPYADPDPAVASDEGRCIMTSGQGVGWDRGDPDTGIGNQRGWCSHCWQRYKEVGVKCSSSYAGDQRRLSAGGNVGPNGAITLQFADVGSGRMGPPTRTSGRAVVTVSDSSGTDIGSFAADAQSGDPGIPPGDGSVAFWARLPLAPSQDLPVKLTAAVEGIVTSTVTAGGTPPTAVLYDQTVECSSPTGTPVTLDGTLSSDPEGDTIYYAWDAGTAPLTFATAAVTQGLFPLGSTSVTLSVKDGTGQGSSVAANVTVQDTAPPSFGNLGTLFRSICEPSGQSVQVPVPSPVVTDACSTSVAVTGEVVVRNGQAVSLPITNGITELPMGTHTIRWTATDEHGNTGTATQILAVVPAIYAGGVADLRDRATVRTTAGGFAALGNSGAGQTMLGVNAHSGTIESRAAVVLRNSAQVYGDVVTEGGIELYAGASVSGAQLPHTPVQVPPPPTLAGLAFPGGAAVSVAEGMASVPPGSYGAGWVNTGAQLVLAAGDYYFHELILEAGSTVELPGPGVRIFIQSQFTHRGRVVDAAGHPVAVEVAVSGTNPVWVEAPFAGRLVAPEAEVKITRSYVGSVVARDLLVEPDVVFTCVGDNVGFCSSAHPSGFCPDDGNSCTEEACGQQGCAYAATADGTSCDDGDACTTGDRCASGSCGGTPLNCDDANACTTDTCNAGTCVHSNAANGTTCSDGNACTANDVCASGICTGTVITPSAPTSLGASAGNNNSAAVTWTASSTAGVTYTVKRGTSPGTYGATVATGVTSTSYTDTGLTGGTTYYYVVVAVGCATSSNSNQASATASGPPSVNITSPANNTSFTALATITINASASDPGGSIAKVEFYRGGTLLGTDTTSPYSYTWSNVPAGSYSLTAKAYDNLNASTTSGAVNVTVTSATNPCAGLCSPATVKTGPNIQSGNLGTGAVCHETTSNLSGGNCSNMTGRTLKANGSSMNCSGWTLPAKRNNGYCIQVTAGGLSYASYATW
jgi:hypothetical protein